jgi:hypothetical protein
MANINVTFTENTITVDETTSNVTVTETVSNIIVSGSSIASNADIRAAISATSPITYNSTTGVIGADANALFTGKTTDDLPEGNTNLYFEDSRAVVAVYNGNVQVKRFAETRVDNGNVSGAVTFNVAQGTIHSAKLVGNVSGITLANIYAGGSATLILQQDEVGGHTLSTNTMTSWKFVNTNSTLDSTANAYNILSVVYDGTTYLASMVDFGTAVSGTITINGVSIPLGGSGNLTTTNIPEGANLYYTNARVLAYVTDSGLDFNAEKVDDRVANLLQTSGNLTFTYNDAANTLTLSQSLTTTDITEGANLYYTTGRANTAIAAYTAANPITVGGNLTVNGNINATGNINYQNVTDLYVTDQKITLNSNAATNANVEVIAFRPTATDTKLRWNEQATRWQFTNDGSTYYNLPTSTSDVAEGTNLYYTNARVTSLLSSGNVTSNVQTGGVLKVWNSSIPANSWIETRYILAYDNTLKITGAQNGGSANINLDVIGNINLSDATTGGAAKYSNFKNGQINHTYYSNDSIFYGGLPGIRVIDNLYNNNVYEYTGGQSGSWFAVRGNLIVDSNTSTITGVTGDGVQINANGTVVASGNITGSYLLGNGSAITGLTTTQVSEGTNLYFTAARARGNISAAENITYNSTTGVIGMANTLANVNSISTESGQDLVLTSEDPVRIRARHRNGTLADSSNIAGEGFALTNGSNFFDVPLISYSGLGELKTVVFDGTTTAGSNVITGVANVSDLQGNPLTIGNILPEYAFCDFPLQPQASVFPGGTYVVSVSGSNVYMSANALLSETLVYDNGDPYASFGSLSPAMRDTTTNLQIVLETDFDDGGANAQLITFNFIVDPKTRYGYGSSGPITTDFTYAIGTASDYAIDTNVMDQFLVGRTNFSADRTVGNFRRGLTVGDADLSNRGENDGIQTFGLNIVWDGTQDPVTDYGTNGLFPQILLKQYTTGTFQATTGQLTTSGPRLLFIGANGDNTLDPLTTYARANQEIGRIGWLSSTSQTVSPSSVSPPAFISVVSNKDQTTSTPNDVGMYLVTSANPNNANRTLWAAQHKANTIISAGSRSNNTSGDIYFAPARQISGGNAVLLAERITDSAQGSPHWAKIGYDNPASNTGAKVSITNGFNTASARNGNITLSLDRNNNGVGFGDKEWAFKLRSGQNDLVLTEDDVIRTTFAAGGNVDITGNINLTGRLLGYDRVYGEFAYTAGNIVPVAADTIYTFPLDTTLINSDVVANNTSRINITKPGFYKLFTSIQIKNSDNSADHIMRFWLRKNGADVANSATLITPLKLQEQVVSMHWMVESDGDDYWEIAYYVNNVNVTFPNYAAITSPVTAPSAPPIIINVIPVGA